MILVVGVNNQGPWVNNAHGNAWAQMINNINSWITGLNYNSQLSARGGMDIEQQVPFGTAAATRSWVDGYSAAFVAPSYFYDFGSCDGCPTTPCPGCLLPQDWTVDKVWYVAYGASAAVPLPDIYEIHGIHAAQWYQMSLYAFTQYGTRMHFIGSMTQYRACLQRGCDPTLMNLPSAGYMWLYNALNADPVTAQSLQYSTDINWQGEAP